VIVDYCFAEHRALPRADQLQLHEIDPELVQTEAGQAGFQLVKRQDQFVKWEPGVGNTRANAADLWLMALTRPD
jgi:hypothetical protein